MNRDADAPQVELTTERLDPVEASVRVAGPNIVSARLTGPRCEYASTVEIAYHFRAADGRMRAIVPEPSLWEPQTPYLYHALLQARDGSIITRQHGLRHVQLATAGLRVNGRPLSINATFREELSDASGLRAAGVNAIVCPVSPATASVWDDADRFGFFVFGLVTRDADSLGTARALRRHASCLGWLLDWTDAIETESLQTRPGFEPLLGWLTDAPTGIPAWAQFVAGDAATAAGTRPWLRITDRADADAGTMGIVRR